MREEIDFTCEYTGTTFKYSEGDTGAYQVLNCPHSHLEDAGLTRCSKLEGWCEVVHPKPKTREKKEEKEVPLPSFPDEFGPNGKNYPGGFPGFEDGPTRPRKHINIDSAIQGPPKIPGQKDINSAIQGPPEI